MTDDNHEINGLIADDDPDLDYILYEEMREKDRKRGNSGGGCLGVLLLFLLPVVPGVAWLIR